MIHSQPLTAPRLPGGGIVSGPDDVVSLGDIAIGPGGGSPGVGPGGDQKCLELAKV